MGKPRHHKKQAQQEASDASNGNLKRDISLGLETIFMAKKNTQSDDNPKAFLPEGKQISQKSTLLTFYPDDSGNKLSLEEIFPKSELERQEEKIELLRREA